MRMAAAPIPRRAEERAGFTASRRNKPVRTGALTKLLVEKGVITAAEVQRRLQGTAMEPLERLLERLERLGIRLDLESLY